MSNYPLEHLAAMPPLEVCNTLGTTPHGLADEEASTRLTQYGPNTIVGLHAPGATLPTPFAHRNTIILVLIGIIGLLSSSPIVGWAMLAAALFNSACAIWQNHLMKQTVVIFHHLIPESVYVRREGQCRIIPTIEVVPGDILALKADSMLVADAYLIGGDGVRLRQHALCGDRNIQMKLPGARNPIAGAPSECTNLLLAGSTIVEGQGSAVAIATGIHTQLSQAVANQTSRMHKPSLLLRVLKTLAPAISRAVIGAGVAVLGLPLLGQPIAAVIGPIAIIAALAAVVPEGIAALQMLARGHVTRSALKR